MKILETCLMVLAFILIGGFFAAAEMAMVSLRDSQVRTMATQGKRGAAVARLAADPNRYLSSIQIGVTVATMLSAALGGESLGGEAARWLERYMPASAAHILGVFGVTLIISYFSIVLGELAAKRFAMQRAESIALATGRFIDAIATVLRPVVKLLDVSTNLVVRLMGGDPKAGRSAVTSEELRSLVTSAESLGNEERAIMDDVFDAGDRTLREVMVPRTEAEFLPGDMPAYKAVQVVQGAPHSRYPVTGRSADDIVGFLHVRDLMDLDSTSRRAPVAQLARPVLSLPDSAKVLRALTQMRRSHDHLAIVRDEYGGTAGIVTLEDLVEELIGDITDEYDVVEERPHDLAHVDGLTSLEDFEDRTGLRLPEGPYDTVAGFVMQQLGRVPQVGDVVAADLRPSDVSDEAEGVELTPAELTVTELDGRRAALIAVQRPQP